MEKCSWGNVIYCPDGEHELDPCLYKEVMKLKNVTIQILKCERCGHVTIGWIRQPDTEEIEDDED